jgi:hypothetical protein
MILALVHLASTLFMTGLIWFVQVVHYPLLGVVGEEGFTRCQSFHLDRTSFVVGPPMLAELFSGLLLYWITDRDRLLLASLALLGVIWFSTAFLQVPRHSILAQGYDSAAHEFLVRSNWIRTIAWSLRAVLVVLWFTRSASLGVDK